MDTLRKFFPLAFTEKKEVSNLVIMAIIHIVVAVIIGIVFKLLGIIPLVGIIIGIVGWIIDIYLTISLVLTFLDYFKVLK